MESRQKSRSYRQFDPADSISAKGKFAFELGADGSFTVCRTSNVADLESRSETSSLEANASTVPDVDSITIEDVGDWVITANLSQKPRLQPFNPSEKSQLVDGVGNWADSVLVVLPWRMEAVNFDDLDDVQPGTCVFDTEYVKPASGSGLIKPHSSSQIPQWNSKQLCRSIAESSESVPPLTEDFSRDSDSIAISETHHNRDEYPIVQPCDGFALHEAKPPLSPQLGSIGTRFVTYFDDLAINRRPRLEKENCTIACDRPHLFCESSHPGDNPKDGDQELFEDDDSVYSEGESTESESIWMSDYSEGVPVLDEGHPFLLIKPGVVRAALDVFQVRQHCPQGSSSNPAAGGTPPTNCAGHANASSQKKRNRGNGDGSEKSRGSGDGEDTPEKRPRTSKQAAGHQVSFACPFAKKDPLKYRSCYAYVLKRIRDVKLHLSRYHQLPIYCPRCMTTFDTEDQRDEHIRASTCPVRDTVSYEGVTRAQKGQLTKRVSSKMTFGDQWFTIFDILFPGHQPKPRSAFMNVELTVDLESFQDLMYAEGPSLISAAISSRGIHMATMANEERELSALLQSAIEEGLQTIAQRWSARMISDSVAPLVAFAEGSASSHSSRNVEGSQRSQVSSATLVEHLLDTHAAEQSQQIERDEQADGEDRVTRRLIQQVSPAQSMTLDVPHLNNSGQSDVLPSDAPNFEQEYYETLTDDVIDEDEVELWKRLSQGNYFPWNDYDDRNAST